jgi:hypothetical protein
LLGGNQSNAITRIGKSRLLGARWPATYIPSLQRWPATYMPSLQRLPTMKPGEFLSSTNKI